MAVKKKEHNPAGIVLAVLGGAAVLGGIFGFRTGHSEAGVVTSDFNPNIFSRWFDVDDVSKSKTATQQGIDNTPTSEVLDNAAQLAQNVLDVLSDYVGKKLQINSWYRSPSLNAAVGGASNSDHMTGNAADVENPNGDNKELLRLLFEWYLPFDQLIIYDSISNPSRLHISYDPKRTTQQRQILLKSGSEYLPVNDSDLYNAIYS